MTPVDGRVSVGVIGSGMAGSFAAHFLHEALGDRVDLVVFERESRVGGRVRQIEIGGRRREAGASSIHSSNRYLTDAIDRLGLRRSSSVQREEEGRQTFGVWNGTRFDFVAPSGKEMALFLARRYGESLVKVQRLVTEALEHFLTIYDRQKHGEAFDTPESLYRSLGLYELSQEEAYAFFRRHGVGYQFVLEMSDGIGRGNYGQDGHMNAWVTLVSLIGGGFGGGELFSVVEGNARICEGLLERSGARLFTGTAVTSLTSRSNSGGRPGGYLVTTEDGRGFACDAVIVATPLEFAGIAFQNMTLPAAARIPRAYLTTHVTFVTGRLNPAYFGLTEADAAPDLIMTREQPEIPFSSIGAGGLAADGRGRIYKLFSREALEEDLLDKIFMTRTETVRLSWKAYPVLKPVSPWPPFRLAKGLYYVNAMESAVSTMETEAIAARNVANLAIEDLGRP